MFIYYSHEQKNITEIKQKQFLCSGHLADISNCFARVVNVQCSLPEMVAPDSLSVHSFSEQKVKQFR